MKPFPSFRISPCLAVALLAACATTKYSPKPLSAESAVGEFQTRDFANDRLRAFISDTAPALANPWPRHSWNLDALTAAAFFYHPDLDVARAQLAEARAAIRSAGARPNPTVTITPGYDFTPNNGDSPWFPGIDFDFPIETAGKRGIRVTRAEAQAHAARLNVTSVAWQLRRNIRGALVDYMAADRKLTLLHEQAEVQKRIVALLQDRRAFGAASTQELSVARIALGKIEMDLAEAERQRADALGHLAETVGVPLAAVEKLKLEFAWDATPPIPPPEARRVALLNRADVKGALADYAAAEADLRGEIAKQYPDVHLGPGYQWDEGGNKWSLGIGIELPVFNRNRGPIAEAEARREESAAKFRALQGKIITAIDRAVANQQVTNQQVVRARETQRALGEQISLMQARLAAGDVDQLEFQNAKLEASMSALALLDAQASAARSAGELEDALQLPFDALTQLEARIASISHSK